ncbi:STAGA complex 65 subunit gamma [Folsomia candida]|uniref:STAGA complex 65 subunit gamma n=1 Tax=Folsomia candida TaxID=158441 RepID=A0A226EN93_FOLCA|nr:STAGA complex 65 subunit gamma [Folsomia candida]
MSQGSHHQETPPVAPPPPAPCIPPIKNLLLLKYDPIKILSRPSLLGSLGGHTATNQIKANHNVANQRIEPVPIFSSLGAANPVIKKKFPPPTCTITSASQVSVTDKDSSLMPPPRAPSAPRAKQARSISVEREPQPSTSKKCMQAYLTASTSSSSSSSSTYAAAAGTNNNITINNRRKRGFPYMYSKLDLVTKKKRKVVKYVNKRRKTCSAKALRLATISFAQKSSASAERLKNMKMKLKKYTRNLSTRYQSKKGKPKIKVKVKGPGKKVKAKVKKTSGQPEQKSQLTIAQREHMAAMTLARGFRVPADFYAKLLQKFKQANDKQKGQKVIKKSVGKKKKKVAGRGGDKKKKLPLPLNIKWFRRKGSSRGRGVPFKIPENHLVNHTIELLRHKRDLQTRVELIDEESVVYKMDEIPKIKEPIPKGQLLIPNIPITGGQAKEIIQNRLPILLAHGGYTHVNERPLEVLADVMENFYMKMAHRLKQVREMEMAGCEQEFPDPLERVMVEMNLGGVRGVEEYYTSRVMDYRNRVEEQCAHLRKLYAHKIRLKVGMVMSSSTGICSSSSSTSTSSHPISPGNRFVFV